MADEFDEFGGQGDDEVLGMPVHRWAEIGDEVQGIRQEHFQRIRQEAARLIHALNARDTIAAATITLSIQSMLEKQNTFDEGGPAPQEPPAQENPPHPCPLCGAPPEAATKPI
jgi:hypothetical protein